MHDATDLDAALGALGGFLREVAVKIGDMAEVEIRAAKRAVRILVHHVLWISKKLGHALGGVSR